MDEDAIHDLSLERQALKIILGNQAVMMQSLITLVFNFQEKHDLYERAILSENWKNENLT